jgi:hypothetical protein
MVAVAAALKVGAFDFKKLSDFLVKKLLPYVAVYAIVKAFGEAAGVGWVAVAAWLFIENALTADLLNSLVVLGIPLPEGLARVINPKKENGNEA